MKKSDNNIIMILLIAILISIILLNVSMMHTTKVNNESRSKLIDKLYENIYTQQQIIDDQKQIIENYHMIENINKD